MFGTSSLFEFMLLVLFENIVRYVSDLLKISTFLEDPVRVQQYFGRSRNVNLCWDLKWVSFSHFCFLLPVSFVCPFVLYIDKAPINHLMFFSWLDFTQFEAPTRIHDI